MIDLAKIINRLDDNHRTALMWFVDHVGQKVDWPDPIFGGINLATKAKGIYKPQGSEYALSIRQSLASHYNDKPPLLRDDGTWAYMYAQEGPSTDLPKSRFTNQSLVRCMEDVIPIGVLIQESPRPKAQYVVLGVALVSGYESGFFFLEGFNPKLFARETGITTEIDYLIGPEEPIPPENIIDARRKILTILALREGQADFRKRLLRAYQNTCAVTNCRETSVLEACHLKPYRGKHTNSTNNGILLRADIHTLFDRGLMSINPTNLRIVLARDVEMDSYGKYKNKELLIPESKRDRPLMEAINYHYTWAQHLLL